jgi:Kae1-associated kinase Bud32
VYLIRAYENGLEKKVLVKRFRDWSGFKWFPLSLWSMGARNFAVLGRTRLQRECAINEVLSTLGFNVPKILHVSHDQRLVFMEYIEGENLVNGINRIAHSKSPNEATVDLSNITKLGEIYAQVHSANVALGDTKPENVIVTGEGQLYLLDLEQATREGDKAWDVAEFLYFTGHYLPLYSEDKAEMITKAFIKGYLTAGGNLNTLQKAGSAKYTRVFSIFTLPTIMRSISNACRKEKTER